MPKLSPSLKSLLSIPLSNPHPYPAPTLRALTSTLDSIRSRSEPGKIGPETWLTLLSAAGVTVNSPESYKGIWDWARPHLREGFSVEGKRRVEGQEAERWGAGIMREVGLKCISFNGVSAGSIELIQIPRTINALNAFRDHLPEEITSGLSTEATRYVRYGQADLRQPTTDNVDSITAQSHALWDAIYAPQHEKLLRKLTLAHPDLPVHILNSHYGALLSDPPSEGTPRAGRILTSMIAITCLRAQGGVAPQVLSHVYGLMKAADQPGEEGLQGREWLVSEEGIRWILESTDAVCEVVRGPQEVKAKL